MCTTNRGCPFRTPFDTFCSRRAFAVHLATQYHLVESYCTTDSSWWVCGASPSFVVAVAAVVVASYEIISWLILVTMASNGIVALGWGSWLESTLAMDMVRMMWTVVATIWRAFVAMSVVGWTKNHKIISFIFSCLFNLPGWSVTKLHNCESQYCFPMALTTWRKFVPMTTTSTIPDEYFPRFSSDILDLHVVVEPCRCGSMSVAMVATRWLDPTRWLRLHPQDQCSRNLRRHCFLVWKLLKNFVNNHPI